MHNYMLFYKTRNYKSYSAKLVEGMILKYDPRVAYLSTVTASNN